MPPAIQVQDVTKRFGSFTAVDRVDLQIEQGEVFGFLGHNGAGKSTMINMLLDHIRPTAGDLEVFGADCQTDTVEAREHMGVLPDGYGVYSGLTGRQHVQFAMESKGVDGEPLNLLDRVGITEAADRAAEGYSKGMTQRMVFAMALVGEPDLLILDEPTSGLDPAGARSMREIILEENKRGATVFFSSHILEQIEAVADRVGIMHQGQLAAVDTIGGLRDMAGGETRLLIATDKLEDTHINAVEALDEVDKAGLTDEGRLAVTCAKGAKMDVLLALDERGVEVLDLTTEEASLEDLFVEYTRRSE
ncbi:ABC transporter ATP-binding protein [Halorubrum ezzemoulense]|uniref:ABC transporter ATP-binding protein n=1 Tax=Halorubrum ezzemoulense TaxID=337243 RepID=UPI00232C85C0|nr:ABC transporter ATP-binding protein [Halorubrum ezzemoulense]MDB2225800.1 ABC transporter ATP-binding protein [Halorubrum ezzemoulense]